MRQAIAAGFALATCIAPCMAQDSSSSVRIYGVMDVGLTHVNNVAGTSSTTMDSGQFMSSRIGFQGTEDLGSGWSALFTLEGGLGVDTGTATMFNRQSFVGLKTPAGTITAGRQYDFIYVTHLPLGTELIVGGLESGVSGGPGGTAGSIKPIDSHYGGTRYDNTVKWVQSWGRFTVGYMRGLGLEDAVAGSTRRVDSALLHYRGEQLVVGLGWVKDDYAAANAGNTANEVTAVKALYTLGNNRIYANYAQAKARNSLARNKPLGLGVLFGITSRFDLGLGVGYVRATNPAGASTHLTQWSLGSMYKLSKRTGLYALFATNGSADDTVYHGNVGAPGGAAQPSSDARQSVVRLGIVHRF